MARAAVRNETGYAARQAAACAIRMSARLAREDENKRRRPDTRLDTTFGCDDSRSTCYMGQRKTCEIGKMVMTGPVRGHFKESMKNCPGPLPKPGLIFNNIGP